MNSARAQLRTLLPGMLLGALLCAAPASAQTLPALPEAASALQQPPAAPIPKEQEGLDVIENVGNRLPLDLSFTDHTGKKVTLGDYFSSDARPAIVVMGYYRCPIVCGVIREKLIQALSGVDNTMGKDFRVLVFSIDPGEPFASATKARAGDHAFYGNHASLAADENAGLDGMIYHVGDATNVRKLADALGYKYKADGNEYNHPVAITLTTPNGTISRYLYGFSHEPKNLKLALMEASEGKLVRTIGERLMAFCYMYDPKSGAYTLQAVRVMQLGGVMSVLAVGTLVGAMFLSEHLKKQRAAAAKQQQAAAPEVVVVGA